MNVVYVTSMKNFKNLNLNIRNLFILSSLIE